MPSAVPLVAPLTQASSSPASTVLKSTAQWAAQRQSVPDERDKAYVALMKALQSWGFFRNLPLGSAGDLVLSAPFCQEFQEAPHLLPFLAPLSANLTVHGCDVVDQPYWWNAWQTWAQHTFGGRIKVQLRQQDLAMELLPAAGLIIACHPEVTRGGPWPAILRNVLQSRKPGAACVFTTFYLQEAEATAQVCRSQGLATSGRILSMLASLMQREPTTVMLSSLDDSASFVL